MFVEVGLGRNWLPSHALVEIRDSQMLILSGRCIIKALAPIMWGHFDREKIRALRLLHVPIGEHGQQTQEGAI
jgi:hypothetical protein